MGVLVPQDLSHDEGPPRSWGAPAYNALLESGFSGIHFNAIAGRDDKDYRHAERGLTHRHL
jgi:hypothetical protein